MDCNCNNNTNQSELRIVRGNDFTTLYRLTAKYADGTAVPDFDLQQCTDVNVVVRRSRGDVSNSKDVSAYGSYTLGNDNILRISWDGLMMKVGTYTVDFSAKYEGVDIRCYSTTELVFDIVETNEEANIPAGSFIDDEFYQFDGGDFVLLYSSQKQADWEQTDDTLPDYIKNKPNYDFSKIDSIPYSASLNQSTNEIDFYDDSGNVTFSVDVTALLKDGSLNNVVYEDGSLWFIFNPDAEKSPIEINIGDIYNEEEMEQRIQQIYQSISEKYKLPDGGIPSSDMSQDVQQVLAKASSISVAYDNENIIINI